MVKGIYIPVSPAQPVELREFPAGEIRKAVGGIVKGIDLPSFGARLCCNVEPLRDPFNARATLLWAHHRPEDSTDAMIGGAAVLVGIADEADTPPDIPERVRQLLLEPNTFRTVARRRGGSRWLGNNLRFPDYWGAITWATLTGKHWHQLEELHVVLESEVDDHPSQP